MEKIKKYSILSVIAISTAIAFCNSESAAAASPAVDTSMRTLTISVENGKNTYEETTVKIMNKKNFKIKKISLKSKNDYIVRISKKNKITAWSPGKTNVIVTIKYQKKSAKTTKLKKKKISIPITVKSEYLSDIPQTGMQYDETGKAKPIYPYTWQYDWKGAYSNDARYIDRFPVWVETD